MWSVSSRPTSSCSRFLRAAPELYYLVAERAREAGADIKILPSISELFSDIVGIRDLRDINLTDVLGRRQVDTDLYSTSTTWPESVC